jgi:hypothetical protein
MNGRMLVIALTCLGLQTAAAQADDATHPNATATRPAKETTGQSSVPNAAPPATTTQQTGSSHQDPTVTQMNNDAKKKVETEGK